MKRYLHKNIIDIKYLLELVVNKSQTWIWTNSDYKLTNLEVEKLEQLIKRRENGEPVAYLSGTKPFYHLDFIVNKHTLIPRPATENIIDIVKNLNLKNAKVLDLGTGSGIIAITLKSLFPTWEITAVDNNSQTLKVAQQNALKNHTEIDFICSNWFEKVQSRFDIIISNPPYICENDKHLQSLFDPINALTAKDNGLVDIKKIIKFAPDFLNKNSYLLLEHGYNQQQQIVDLLNNFAKIQLFDDLNGINRNILATT